MFAHLDARLLAQDRTWSQVDVLDLCAGSGALGLEAWSRGARSVTCVENDRAAARTIEGNRAALGADAVTVIRGDARTVSLTDAVQCCVIDPPYAWSSAEVAQVLARLVDLRVLIPDAIVVAERSSGSSSPFPPSISVDRERSYGDTTLWYGHVVDQGGA